MVATRQRGMFGSIVLLAAVAPAAVACSTAVDAHRAETEAGVRTAVQEILQIDAARLRPSVRLKEDLGADSLDCVEIVMAIEERFGITVADDAVAGMKTVGNVVDYVDARRKGARTGTRDGAPRNRQ